MTISWLPFVALMNEESPTSLCPQCGAAVPREAWNCPACQINLYWAQQHAGELRSLREARGSATPPETPGFLVESSRRVRGRGSSPAADGKVRALARQLLERTFFRQRTEASPAPEGQPRRDVDGSSEQ